MIVCHVVKTGCSVCGVTRHIPLCRLAGGPAFLQRQGLCFHPPAKCMCMCVCFAVLCECVCLCLPVLVFARVCVCTCVCVCMLEWVYACLCAVRGGGVSSEVKGQSLIGRETHRIHTGLSSLHEIIAWIHQWIIPLALNLSFRLMVDVWHDTTFKVIYWCNHSIYFVSFFFFSNVTDNTAWW
jgi:hypothetical protein